MVLVLLLGSFALFSGGLSVSGGEALGDDGVSRPELRALKLGSSRDHVVTEFGEGAGLNALEFSDTGAALEPPGVDCVYFLKAPDGNGIVQLCFRDDRLVRKQIYADPLG